MEYKIYARVNENNVVTKIFCNAFVPPLETDVLIEETNERQKANYYQIRNEEGILLYKIVDGQLVKRDITLELEASKIRNLELQRERERIIEYSWVDSQISKLERMKLFEDANVASLESNITALRQYANVVWATQQQANYPQSVTYVNRPMI